MSKPQLTDYSLEAIKKIEPDNVMKPIKPNFFSNILNSIQLNWIIGFIIIIIIFYGLYWFSKKDKKPTVDKNNSVTNNYIDPKKYKKYRKKKKKYNNQYSPYEENYNNYTTF